jgi:hypothetical protein
MSTVAVANLKARTQEAIAFSFKILPSIAQSTAVGEPNIPYILPLADWYSITERVHISVKIPERRPVPNRVIVKLRSVNDNGAYPIVEYQELVLLVPQYGEKRDFQTWASGLTLFVITGGKPLYDKKSQQTAEFILDFGNYMELLTCPVNGTTTFGMCFWDAYLAQRGRIE